MKAKLILLAVVVITSTLYFNSDFLQPEPEGYDWAYQEDHRNVLAGYRAVHSFADTLPWWYGFIDKAHPSLRPLSSYMFYGMTWLGETHGYKWDAWITFALFAANCLLVAALVYRLTRSEIAALVSGALSTMAATWLPTMQTQSGGIPFDWHYLSDNTLLILFLLPALIYFLLWREYGQRKHLALSYASFVLACLTKEQGYIIPLMALALCFAPLPGERVTAKRAVIHAGAMALVSGVFYVFRGMVLVAPHNPPSRTAALAEAASGWLQSIAPPTPYQIVMLMDVKGALKATACYAAVGYGVYLLWKYRVQVWQELTRPEVAAPLKCAALLWVCAMISYLPALGFDVAGHRGLLAVFLKCSACAVALQAVYPYLLKYHQIIQRHNFTIFKRPVVDSRAGNRAA